MESALEGEITDHLGYERHDPAGKNGGNSRNGTRSKIVLSDSQARNRAWPVGPGQQLDPQAVISDRQY